MEITYREREVLQLITEEFTTKEIAQKLYLSIETIKTHRKNIKIKLNARNTAGLVSKAYRQGLMAISVFVIMVFAQISDLQGQTRNLHIEGSGDQYGVIQSSSTGSSKSGIELLRGNAFNSTDWRIQNDGGQLRFEDGIDNFNTNGTLNMSISSNGVVNLYNGSDAVVGNNESGTLIIGIPGSDHLALDNNSIIARNNNISSSLLLQTGVGQGDTYLNNLSGDVGIGTLAPETKLGIEDNGFQVRLGNTQQLDNDWYIGASHEGWTVGGGKLVISPSTASGNAMLILDSEENTISGRSNRIISVEDPINERDVVNLRTLESHCSTSEISTSQSNLDFEGCASRCSSLTEGGHTDWELPSIHQAVQFVNSNQSSTSMWTSDFAGITEPGGIFGNLTQYHIINLDDGAISLTVLVAGVACRCVR